MIRREASELDPEQYYLRYSKPVGEQVAVTRHGTHFLTTCLPGTLFACQESRTLRTRVAALESTGIEGLAHLVRGAGTPEAEGSKVEKS